MAMSTAREGVMHMLRTVSAASCRCPAHSQTYGPVTSVYRHGTQTTRAQEKEYAFEMTGSNIRYGAGVTKEVGMDFKNLKAKKVCIMTDKNIAGLAAMATVLDSFTKHDVSYEIYDKVRVEPTDTSFQHAIDFAKNGQFDAYLAVGGGSVMDTCKVANLCASKPEMELFDFVSAPIGKGLPVDFPLKPLIAVSTTAGTGSETTGAAVFDYEAMKVKTAVASRALRPLLGIVDPLHTLTMPERLAANCGFDLLCHALESYTALPYTERTPRPADPKLRPAYQGSNPLSDVWALYAIRAAAKYFKRAVYDPEDLEARANVHLASVVAGIGFGNAGCHLCHAMSYPISGGPHQFKCDGYPDDHPLIPHGLSVVLTAPAVFSFTYPMCPERHLKAAEILGADVRNVKREDAGRVLSDQLRVIMQEMKVVNGLKAVGYDTEHIPQLVKGTLPQERLIKVAPRPQTEEDLAKMFEDSMTIF